MVKIIPLNSNGWAAIPFSAKIATLVAADGPALHGVGAKMMITDEHRGRFLSGGCVENDVARRGREVIATNMHRLLRYGKDSAWFDIKLACGAAISILIEPVKSALYRPDVDQANVAIAGCGPSCCAYQRSRST